MLESSVGIDAIDAMPSGGNAWSRDLCASAGFHHLEPGIDPVDVGEFFAGQQELADVTGVGPADRLIRLAGQGQPARSPPPLLVAV